MRKNLYGFLGTIDRHREWFRYARKSTQVMTTERALSLLSLSPQKYTYTYYTYPCWYYFETMHHLIQLDFKMDLKLLTLFIDRFYCSNHTKVTSVSHNMITARNALALCPTSLLLTKTQLSVAHFFLTC